MNSDCLNLSKRKKRDLLSELLAGTSTEGIVSKKELNALNKVIQSAPVIIRSVTDNSPVKSKINAAPGKKQKKSNIKTTCYLSEEIFKRLNTAQIEIQSLVPDHLRSRISKSHLVNQALAVMLAEFETKGKKSRLIQDILRYI